MFSYKRPTVSQTLHFRLKKGFQQAHLSKEFIPTIRVIRNLLGIARMEVTTLVLTLLSTSGMQKEDL
jgi:hypothetical protein